MQILRSLWLFIKDQVLGMKWLNVLIGDLLSLLGLDTASRLGGSVQFFVYDVVKITVLLCFLIFVISYIQSYFPPERSKRILGRFHGIGANIISRIAGYSDTLLFLLVYSAVYRLYQCRVAAGGYILVPDFLPNGRPG